MLLPSVPLICVSSSSSCKTLIRSYTGGYAAKGREKNSVYMCTWVVNEKDCIKPEQRKSVKSLMRSLDGNGL